MRNYWMYIYSLLLWRWITWIRFFRWIYSNFPLQPGLPIRNCLYTVVTIYKSACCKSLAINQISVYLDSLIYKWNRMMCRFAEYVNATVANLHPLHCTRQRKVQVEIDITTIPAFLVVFFVLWMVLKPRRPKPKIN